MKSFFTTILLCYSVSFLAQVITPTVQGTYLPVKGTSVKQAWEYHHALAVPVTGTNVVWDYSSQFTGVGVGDTFQIKTMDPSQTPYGQYFPNATHATFLRAPAAFDILDSLYSYLIIDMNGLYSMGGFSQKYDSSYHTFSPYELYIPSSVTYGDTKIDTSRFIGFVKHYAPYPSTPSFTVDAKIKDFKGRNLSVLGYGTLKVPNTTYNNVLLIKEVNTIVDSFYIDQGNGTYLATPSFISPQNLISYYFIRNNTFGTSYLMYLNVNGANTAVNYGYYNLPVDTGSIAGTVFTNTLETTPVTNGEAYLYRENSNFAKNDILATVPLDANGNYHFNSIPYGIYRVAIRPNVTSYPTAFITYFGDTTDWIQATPINTFSTPVSSGHTIHLQYQDASGAGNIIGQLSSNSSIMRTAAVNPIPGVGIVVKKNPGGGASRNIVTNVAGTFSLGTLDNGNYELFVDMPGLQMAGTYSFTISGGNLVTCLDYAVGTHSIHPTCVVAASINEPNATNDLLTSYPNPYTLSTSIHLQLPQNETILLEVYNMLGEKVQVLDEGKKQAGIYTYPFSARHLNYPSGMYFVKLSTGNKTSTLKIIEQ